MTIIFNNNFEPIKIHDNKKSIIDIFFDCKGEKNIEIEKDTNVNYIFICYQSEIVINIVSSQENSSAHIQGLLISSPGTSKISCNHILKASHTSSNIHLVSFVNSNQSISLEGGIKIDKHIQKASGHLLEETLLLGDNAKVHALPMLDVQSNDVSASHGARIEKISKENLFYMLSKGMSFDTAKNLIITGKIESLFINTEAKDNQNISDIKQKVISLITS